MNNQQKKKNKNMGGILLFVLSLPAHGPLCNFLIDLPSARAALAALSKRHSFKNIPASLQTGLSVSGHPFSGEQTPFINKS